MADVTVAEHTIRALTRERNEALERAERQTRDAIAAIEHAQKANRERDEARAELAIRQTGALPPLEHLLRENERLMALLREVEWHGGSGTVEVPCCPLCYGHGEGPFKGHTPDCRLAAALEQSP